MLQLWVLNLLILELLLLLVPAGAPTSVQQPGERTRFVKLFAIEGTGVCSAMKSEDERLFILEKDSASLFVFAFLIDAV